MKVSASAVKAKHDQCLRPSNVKFVETPKINKPVCLKDVDLLYIQRVFLLSAMTPIPVMKTLFQACNDKSILDIMFIIDTLKDCLIF